MANESSHLAPRSISKSILKTPLKLITEYILQTDRKREARFSVLCRKSIVKNRVGQVVEYPAGRLAASKTTMRPNASAKQWFSFPIPLPSTITFNVGSAGLRREVIRSLHTYSRYGEIEQDAEVDLNAWCQLQIRINE